MADQVTHPGLHAVLETALAAAGVVLEHATVTDVGGRDVVKVVLDRPERDPEADAFEPTASLSLDEIAEATRVVSAALDDQDVMGAAPYTLEVTTPGTARPLREPSHFRRNAGRRATIDTTDGAQLTGRIVRAGAADLDLSVPGPKKGMPSRTTTLAYAAIERGVIELEFSRPEPSSQLEPDARHTGRGDSDNDYSGRGNSGHDLLDERQPNPPPEDH